MRQRQEGRVASITAVEEKVEVDRPWLFLGLVAAAAEVFDPEEAGHHLRPRDVRRTDLRDHVEEVVGAWYTDRLGLVNAGQFGDVEAGLHQPADSEQEITRTVAEVRPDPDVGCDVFVIHDTRRGEDGKGKRLVSRLFSK
jgi:hypothetical protein